MPLAKEASGTLTRSRSVQAVLSRETASKRMKEARAEAGAEAGVEARVEHPAPEAGAEPPSAKARVEHPASGAGAEPPSAKGPVEPLSAKARVEPGCGPEARREPTPEARHDHGSGCP